MPWHRQAWTKCADVSPGKTLSCVARLARSHKRCLACVRPNVSPHGLIRNPWFPWGVSFYAQLGWCTSYSPSVQFLDLMEWQSTFRCSSAPSKTVSHFRRRCREWSDAIVSSSSRSSRRGWTFGDLFTLPFRRDFWCWWPQSWCVTVFRDNWLGQTSFRTSPHLTSIMESTQYIR